MNHKVSQPAFGIYPFAYRTQSNLKYERTEDEVCNYFKPSVIHWCICYRHIEWSHSIMLENSELTETVLVKTWDSKIPVHTWNCHKVTHVLKVCTKHDTFSFLLVFTSGHAVVQLVEVLCYKPQGHGFDSVWCHWILHCHNPSDHTVVLELAQPVTEMSSRYSSWGGGLKAAGVQGWQAYHLHVPVFLKSGSVILLELLEPVQELLWFFTSLTFTYWLIVSLLKKLKKMILAYIFSILIQIPVSPCY